MHAKSVRRLALAAVIAGATPFALAPHAFAIGPESLEQPVKAKGKWDEKWGELGDDYKAAVKLSDDGKYAEAFDAFQKLNKPEDPRVLTYLGFTTRKLGNPKDSLVYYDKAISIEPGFAPAREYRGEAYIQLGQIDKAKAELAEIEKICGNTTCEAYTDLAKSLAAAPKS